MKKIVFNILNIMFVLLITICTSGCAFGNPYGDYPPNKNDAEYQDEIDAVFDEVIAYIDAGDEDGLKGMFSENALEQTEDFHEGFSYLTKFLRSNMTKTSVGYSGVSSYATLSHGKSETTLTCTYIIETVNGNFDFTIHNVAYDTIDEKGLGLAYIALDEAMPDTDEIVNYDIDEADRTSCIYVPPKITDDEYKNADSVLTKILGAIRSGDAVALKNLFSPVSISAINSASIEYVMNVYQGALVSKDFECRATSAVDAALSSKVVDYCYTVTTDADTYIVYFRDVVTDENGKKDSALEGIEMLQIISLSDADNLFNWGENCPEYGIYTPGN